MGKLKDAVQARIVSNGPPCSVATLRETMPPDLRADLDELLLSKAYSTVIADEAKKLGYPIADTALNRHRNHRCECGKRPA